MATLSIKLRLIDALGAVYAGHSVRQAAELASVDRTTLRRRLQGVPSRDVTNEGFQALSKAQEDYLANWAITQGILGYSPRLSHFKHFAQRILSNNGVDQKLGNRWYRRFLARHPEVRSLRAQLTDYKRVNAATPENINLFFDRLDSPATHDILPENIWNADEVGIAMGLGDNGIMVGDAHRKFLVAKYSGNREWVTILECISAAGRILNPLVIFAGGSIQQQWFPDKNNHRYEDWFFEFSSIRWTNDHTALKWLRGIFIPRTKPEDIEQWRLLIIDGHGSHKTPEFMAECLSHKIWVVFLPAYTSYILQPCDLGFFSTMKSKYRR